MNQRSIEKVLTSSAPASSSKQAVILTQKEDANLFLQSEKDMQELAYLTTQAFAFHHPAMAKAYDESPNQSEFLKLSDEQLFDSVRQIALAQINAVSDGIMIIARDTSKPGSPIVGMVSGVRNGHPHPSHEYMDKLMQSKCGLGEAIFSAFGPVIQCFDMNKMNQHTNVFMLGMIAVHPDYMQRGIASELSKMLFTELHQHYDGMFSIITSPKARGLLMKMMSHSDNANKATLIELENSGASQFFGLGFNEKGIETFNVFNTSCRNMPEIQAVSEHADSARLSPRH